MNNSNKIDPVLYLLAVCMLVFTGILIWVEYRFQNDGQMFQVIAGLLTGFAGSFFTRLKPPDKQADNTPPPLTAANPAAATPPAPAFPPLAPPGEHV